MTQAKNKVLSKMINEKETRAIYKKRITLLWMARALQD